MEIGIYHLVMIVQFASWKITMFERQIIMFIIDKLDIIHIINDTK